MLLVVGGWWKTDEAPRCRVSLACGSQAAATATVICGGQGQMMCPSIWTRIHTMAIIIRDVLINMQPSLPSLPCSQPQTMVSGEQHYENTYTHTHTHTHTRKADVLYVK